MAKDKKNKSADTNTENKEGGKGNVVKMAIIIIVAMVVMTVGILGGIYYIVNKNSDLLKTTAGESSKISTSATQNGGSKIEVSEKSYSFKEEFLVNLADEGGKKFLKAKVTIGYSNKKMDKEFEEKAPILRDVIIDVLRSKKSTDFSAKGVEEIKKEILTRVSPVFKNGKPENIYIPDIIVQ